MMDVIIMISEIGQLVCLGFITYMLVTRKVTLDDVMGF
jgi:hypothetical protein